MSSALVGRGQGELARRLDFHGRWMLPLALISLVAWIAQQARATAL